MKREKEKKGGKRRRGKRKGDRTVKNGVNRKKGK